MSYKKRDGGRQTEIRMRGAMARMREAAMGVKEVM